MPDLLNCEISDLRAANAAAGREKVTTETKNAKRDWHAARKRRERNAESRASEAGVKRAQSVPGSSRDRGMRR